MAYGAYMPREVTDPKTGKKKPVSILSTVAIIAVLDTLVALGAGMAMFPLLFSGGLEVGQGPGMMFVTLPLAFGSIPGGVLFGTLFFLLVVCAAWSSSISLGEPVVAWLVEKGLTRAKAAILEGQYVPGGHLLRQYGIPVHHGDVAVGWLADRHLCGLGDEGNPCAQGAGDQELQAVPGVARAGADFLSGGGGCLVCVFHLECGGACR